MMLAAAVPDGFAGRLVDFGAGVGAAGIAVASRCARAQVVLAEKSPEMADFARQTIAHPGNAHLASRLSLIQADVTLAGKARAAAGLPDNAFDFAIMNPPFNNAADRATPDALKRAAHVMDEGMFESWLRSAAAVVRPHGGVAIIARPISLEPILRALQGRFGGLRIVPVHPRAHEPAIRIIVRAALGSRAGLRLMPALVIHDDGRSSGGVFSEKADAISNGRAPLLDD